MEATMVYHLIKECQTFQSATCTAQLIREVFGKIPDFKCGATKAEAIATGKFLLSNQIIPFGNKFIIYNLVSFFKP